MRSLSEVVHGIPRAVSSFSEKSQELLPGPFDLAAGRHFLEPEPAFLHLVLANDEDPGRFELVGPTEMGFHPPVLELDQAFDPVGPEIAGQFQAGSLGLCPEVGEVEHLPADGIELGHRQHPLHAHGEADAADVGPAEILHHVVVAAAAEQGVLGAEAAETISKVVLV